ncbi:MAG: hypothetical protein JXR23_01910 [Pontiellaceae bacterium]|nr:hypothetical protein [Pontiellaceae bacterium]
MQIIDECSRCGKRGITSARKFAKERRRNLARLRKDISDKQNARRYANALHTLIIYDMESEFNKARKSIPSHFETNPQIQLLIAQGLSRFGHQGEATIYCRKAIVLGAGEEAEEFLRHCETLQTAAGNNIKNPLKSKFPVLAYVPLTLLIILLITAGALLSKSSLNYANAWIVNGTLQSYTFSIDDESYTLSPAGIEKIKIGLGEHTLKMGAHPALSFTNDKPQIKQFLNKTLVVINPDDMALIALPKAEKDEQPGTTSYSHSGQIRVFENVPFSKKEFKQTLLSPPGKIDSIALFRPQNHEGIVKQLQHINQPEAAEKYARNALEMNPLTKEADLLIPLAVKPMDDQQTLAFLKKQLDHIPSLLDWHLYYQDYMKVHYPETNLEAEYYERCQQNISEPESRYLLARVAKDRSLAYQFYEASDLDYGMNGMGYSAIAYELYLLGSFSEAQPYIQKALQHDPSNMLFRELYEHILLAQRNYKKLAEELLQTNLSSSSDETTKKAVIYLTCAGFHQEAMEAITKHAEEGSAQYARLNAHRLYAIGNVVGYLQNLRAAKDAHVDFEEFLYAGKIESADEALTALEFASWQDHLLLYCAAMQQDNEALAKQNMDQTIESLSKETLTHQQIADLLRKAQSVTPDSIQKLDIEAPEKALLLTAFGWNNPAQKTAFHALARLYNFTPTHPQLFIEELLSD